MDPSATPCLTHDSLKTTNPAIDTNAFANAYTSNTRLGLSPHFNMVSTTDDPSPIFCNERNYMALRHIKDSFDNPRFIEARNATNPFEYIGKSIFINRAAIKIANIDAVYKVLHTEFTFDNQTSNKDYTFCDVAAGPGGFTQYVQYRYPNAVGYGMTLRSPSLDWSTKFLDMKRFTAFYGPDNTGNLYTNWDTFTDFVLPHGPVDLVMADGGFDLEDNADKTLIHRQEFLSSRLLLTQALIGVAVTKMNGNFVLKVFDTVTTFSAHVLFILSQCFETIRIFKPLSSRPANSERYVICMNRHRAVDAYLNIFKQAARTYTDDRYLSTLFSEALPLDFVQWLTYYNNDSIAQQLRSARDILLYLNGSNPPVTQYNIDKFLVIWNLPDTPTHKRDTIQIMI